MNNPECLDNDAFGSYYAMSVAFKTMKERCRQLQMRLAAVEEENLCLRLECGRDMSTTILKHNNNSDKSALQVLQEKTEELSKEKSQLTHHVFVVATENRQLWNRLMKLSKPNKSVGSQLTKISDTFNQYPTTQSDALPHKFCDASNKQTKHSLITDSDGSEQSLEDIPFQLINNIIEKSELEQQYAEMVELHKNSELNLQDIGFTYPEDSDTDSLEQLKQHEIRLSQTKDALLGQQTRLKRALENFKRMRKETICHNCRKNANKKMCQTGTQSDSDEYLKEHEATQTSLMKSAISLEKYSHSVDNIDVHYNICPLCGIVYGKAIPFTEFHEHVLSHFSKELSVEGFELIH